MEPQQTESIGVATSLRVGEPLLFSIPYICRGTLEVQWFHGITYSSNIQKSKEEFGAEEKTEGRGIPVVVETSTHRRMAIVAFVGHFRVESKLFG